MIGGREKEAKTISNQQQRTYLHLVGVLEILVEVNLFAEAQHHQMTFESVYDVATNFLSYTYTRALVRAQVCWW